MESPILSAGGVLEKGSGDERRVCVVRRQGHGDCVLPRGKVEAGEAVRDAVRRELKEETGCDVELVQLVQLTERFVEQRRKLTLYWRLKLVAEGRPSDAPETSKPEWLTVQGALDALTHADEREVVRKAFALRRAAAAEPDELKRTRHRLELLENELKALKGALPEKHVEAAQTSLDSAARELDDGDAMGAWQHLLAAQRELLFAPGDERLEAQRVAILAEAGDKLPGWRREAVTRMLGVQGKVAPEVVAAAAAIRDEHGQNEHAKSKLLKDQLGVLALLVFVLCAVLAAAGVLGSASKTGLLLGLGFLGGAMSAVVPLSSWRTKRIPDLTREWQFRLLRPTLGAASALGACLVLGSGLLGTTQPTEQVLMCFAFAAGFSERFLTNTIAQIGGGRDD